MMANLDSLPTEEGGGGGKMMVDEGVLNGVSGVFGMHVWPLYPSGVAAIRVGHVLRRDL